MSEIIKQSMSNIWASAGDIVAPDSVKIADGWLVEVVPRQYWNWMQNRTDTNLAYLFQHGIPEWDSTVEYIANKSYVTYADAVYKAILTGTNQNPTTATTYWKVAFATSTAALEALKETTPAANKLPYFNSASTAATTTITPLARTLLDDTTQGEMLTTVGAQPVDATLTALAGVTTATNKLPYFSGVDTATVTDLSAFGRSLIDDADATAARATLVLNNVNNTSDANKPVSVAQQAALDLKAPLLSPALTGVPTAPTAAAGTSSTQLATTAYVTGQAATVVSPMDGTAAVGTSLRYARQDHVHASDTSRLPLTGGNMTGDLIYQNVAVGGWARGLSAKIQSTAAYAAGIGFMGGSDSLSTVYLGVGESPWISGNGVRVTAAGVTISGATTFDTLITGSVNGNAATATTLSGDQSNWASLRSNAVANMLGWKNYGNSHVIFDASAGTAPNGTAISQSNSQVAWTPALPTLMGWNGSTTYGVRVDSARVADSCTDSGWITATLVNGFTHNAGSPLHYRKVGNTVYVKGTVDRTTPPGVNVVITTLPAGFRPTVGDTHLNLWITNADFSGSLRTIGVTAGGDVVLVFSYQMGATAPSGAGNIAINTSYPV